MLKKFENTFIGSSLAVLKKIIEILFYLMSENQRKIRNNRIYLIQASHNIFPLKYPIKWLCLNNIVEGCVVEGN